MCKVIDDGAGDLEEVEVFRVLDESWEVPSIVIVLLVGPQHLVSLIITGITIILFTIFIITCLSPSHCSPEGTKKACVELH